MPDYFFEIGKYEAEVKRKFCNESSTLPFDVDRKLFINVMFMLCFERKVKCMVHVQIEEYVRLPNLSAFCKQHLTLYKRAFLII